MKFASVPLALILSTACIAQPTYTRYLNARFAFSVEYPSQLFSPRGECENGDGQTFAAKDAEASLTVYGGWLLEGFSCEALETAKSDTGANVTYKWKKDAASVASGYTSDRKFFYVKRVRNADKCLTLILKYSEARRETFDPLVSRIAGSLRG